jgi:hypothetical protein
MNSKPAALAIDLEYYLHIHIYIYSKEIVPIIDNFPAPQQLHRHEVPEDIFPKLGKHGRFANANKGRVTLHIALPFTLKKVS